MLTLAALVLSFVLHAEEPYVIENASAGDSQYRVVRLDTAKTRLKLHWQDAKGEPYAYLAHVRDKLVADGHKFVMATNAGIYGLDDKPVGLHIENGKKLRPVSKSRAPGGNFSMVPNGIFLMTAKGPRVVETSEFASIQEPVEFATQSGPILVHKGKLHPKFRKGSENRKLRSGVGVDRDGKVVFAISHGTVSFYDFAVFFRDQLHCANALYLDGTISKILVQDEVPEQFVAFAGILAATVR